MGLLKTQQLNRHIILRLKFSCHVFQHFQNKKDDIANRLQFKICV